MGGACDAILFAVGDATAGDGAILATKGATAARLVRLDGAALGDHWSSRAIPETPGLYAWEGRLVPVNDDEAGTPVDFTWEGTTRRATAEDCVAFGFVPPEVQTPRALMADPADVEAACAAFRAGAWYELTRPGEVVPIAAADALAKAAAEFWRDGLIGNPDRGRLGALMDRVEAAVSAYERALAALGRRQGPPGARGGAGGPGAGETAPDPREAVLRAAGAWYDAMGTDAARAGRADLGAVEGRLLAAVEMFRKGGA